MGTVLGWTGSAFDSMRDENSVPRLLDSDENKEAKTWIGSSMTLGALVGAMISGLFTILVFHLFSIFLID